jgi:hypothetical protein
MGFVITGCANLMILGEIPSYPVAFLMFNLFICLVTKSSFIGLKITLFKDFFYISRGEHVKQFVIDAYL